MDWVSGLLKDLLALKHAKYAFFVTFVLCIYFDYPNVKLFKSDILLSLFTLSFVFVGALITIETIFGICNILKIFSYNLYKWFIATNLNRDEIELLLIMGTRPTESINITKVDFEEDNYGQLKLLNLTTNLANKGLISIDPWNPHIVWLSNAGQKRALEIINSKLTQ